MLQKHDQSVIHTDYIVIDDEGRKGDDDYYTIAEYLDHNEGKVNYLSLYK